jgi:hypothetical protein
MQSHSKRYTVAAESSAGDEQSKNGLNWSHSWAQPGEHGGGEAVSTLRTALRAGGAEVDDGSDRGA